MFHICTYTHAYIKSILQLCFWNFLYFFYNFYNFFRWLDLPISEWDQLKSPTLMMDLLIFLVIATFCFMYFEVLLLDACKFLIVIPSFSDCSFSSCVVPLFTPINSFFALNLLLFDNNIMSSFLWLVLPSVPLSSYFLPAFLCCF